MRWYGGMLYCGHTSTSSPSSAVTQREHFSHLTSKLFYILILHTYYFLIHQEGRNLEESEDASLDVVHCDKYIVRFYNYLPETLASARWVVSSKMIS